MVSGNELNQFTADATLHTGEECLRWQGTRLHAGHPAAVEGVATSWTTGNATAIVRQALV